MTKYDSQLAVIALIIIGIICAGIIIHQNSIASVDIQNITVTEKYAQYNYQAQCGKTKCTRTTDPTLIDENGILYTVPNVDLWAKFKINNTYTVRVITKNQNKHMFIINAVNINNVWIQVR